jgi:2-oxoisovalerate dehydrogenase E1 component
MTLQEFDWKQIAYHLLVSRGLDDTEENQLLATRKILYQFSARGHDMAQIILSSLIDHPHDAVSGYYRSRPMLLVQGLSIADAFAGPLGRAGGLSDGRDIGVVFNFPKEKGPIILPMGGDVGSQYTPIVGWAQAIGYRREVLGESHYEGAIGLALGGDASVATNGFWSSLNIATTLNLPMVYYIEDNGYGISVPSVHQTPGANIAKNLASFGNLHILDGDGTLPDEAATLFSEAIHHARSGNGPALVRLRVPRLSGHSGQDTQAYKSEERVREEEARDPLPRLYEFLVPKFMGAEEWKEIANRAQIDVKAGLEEALQRPDPDPTTVHRHIFQERLPDGRLDLSQRGGLANETHTFAPSTTQIHPEATRTNMATAIRRTLDHELATNPNFLLFGEDVGPKGGVHAVTMGLQETHGDRRVFDTSLSEEGIVGRAIGMACCGLMPMAEIQFRKYMDPATEQLHNCGTMRWRTNNRFSAPIVVRTPVGHSKCGDPWHSVSDEADFAHAVGWRIAYPSNAEDATGLLRSALRGNDPTLFLEHRAMLDAPWARRPYPGDDYVLDFGKAHIVRNGEALTLVSWGGMVVRCVEATKKSQEDVEIIDLRTIQPWDRSAVLKSVEKTGRCLIVHEDRITAGFGAEIAACLAKEAFFSLDAPVERLAVNDIPIPYNIELMEAVLPGVDEIAEKIAELITF